MLILHPTKRDTLVQLQVVVHTSEESGGAFDGEVWMVITDDCGNQTQEILLPSDRYR